MDILDNFLETFQKAKDFDPNLCFIINKSDNKNFVAYSCELTDNKFGREGFRTGDYAKYDKSGYLYYIGKKENILNIDGFLVSPKEIESTILEYPGVVEVAITHDNKEENNKQIIAYIVKEKEIDTMELMKYCGNNLEPYKIPSSFKFVNEIPKTWSGKIEKFKLYNKISKICD